MKISFLHDLAFQPNTHNPNIAKKVLIPSGQIPHLTGFTQAVFPPGEVASEHSHADMVEVFFVEKGQANIKINGKNITANAGTCITVETNEAHEVSNQSAANTIITYFGIVVSDANKD